MSFREKTDWLRKLAEKVTEQERSEVVIYLPDTNVADEFIAQLKNMPENAIRALLKPTLAYIRGKCPVFLDSRGQPGKRVEVFESLQAMRYWDILRSQAETLLANFWPEPHNLSALLEAMPEDERTLLTEEMLGYYVTDTRAQDILGSKYTALARSSWKNCTNALLLEHYVFRDRSSVLFYCTHYIIRSLLLRYLYPEQVLLSHAITDLPEEKGMLTFSGEDDIFDIIGVLKGFVGQAFDFWGYSGMTPRKRKEACRLMQMREFFSSSPVDDDLSQRTAMVVATYITLCNPKKEIGRSAMDDLDAIFSNKSVPSSELMAPMLLCHISGLRKDKVSSSFFSRMLDDIQEALKKLTEEKWMGIDDFVMLVRLTDKYESHSCIFTEENLNRMAPTNKRTWKRVRHDKTVAQLTTPAIQGYIFLLAAFGFAEIAYRQPKQDDVSCFSGLMFFRLTRLGRFMLGMESEYVQKAPAAMPQLFEADAERLILRSLSAENQYLHLVETISKRISGGLYLVTEETFLKSCSTRQDLERKIDMFRSMICQDPPANWTAFFESLKAKCGRITEVEAAQYDIWDIAPKARELQRVISSDTTLRKHTLIAEGCMLLVKRSHTAEVVRRLKSYGYLIDMS